MSFQAYLDNIQAKTGQRPQEIAARLRAEGLARPSEMVAWLKQQYGLGHGHAMAIVSLLRREGQPPRPSDDRAGASAR